MNTTISINITNAKNTKVSIQALKTIGALINNGVTEGTVMDQKNRNGYYWSMRQTP